MRQRRVWIGVAATAALFMLGLSVAWTQTGNETVATQTFTNVVTYTIPTETETVVSTVTVTAPTTTAPPTTTEPPPPPPAGTTVLMDGTTHPLRLVCRQPLSNYGPLPIRFVSHITNTQALQLNNGILRFETGCRGDGNNATIDAIVNLHGNGREFGSDDDALVVAGATDIQLTGFAECGWLAPGSHQDAFRFNRGGPNIDLIEFTSGDWSTLTATCWGAGGNVYLDNVNQDPAGSIDAVCVRCKVVGTKFYDPNGGPAGTALGIGWSTNSGARDSCFAARQPIMVYASTSHPGFINQNNVAVDLDDALPNNPGACPLP